MSVGIERILRGGEAGGEQRRRYGRPGALAA